MSNEIYKPGDIVRYTSPCGKYVVQGVVPGREDVGYVEEEGDQYPNWPTGDGDLVIIVDSEGIESVPFWITDLSYVTFIKRVDS